MLLSIVSAVRNEARYLTNFLADLSAQEPVPGSVEILFADGMSNDATLEILHKWSRESYPFPVRILPNPARRQYPGVNMLLPETRGRYVLIVDGHSRLPCDFVKRNVEVLDGTSADIVGGVCETKASSASLGQAIAAALSSPFGVGGSRFRTGVAAAGPADCAPFPCIRREVFERIGLFREGLGRGTDSEFYSRARKAGCQIWLDPRIHSTYFAKSGLLAVARQMSRNGYWWSANLGAARLRHVVPLFFVLALVGLPLVGAHFAPAIWLWLGMLATYVVAALASAVGSRYGKLSWRDRLAMLFVFPVMHLSYGLGSLLGFVSPAVWKAWLGSFRRPPQLRPQGHDDRARETA